MLRRVNSGHLIWQAPNGSAGTLSPELIKFLSKWKQTRFWSKEAGGLLLGFVDQETDGLLIESATKPGSGDCRGRTSFYRGSRHQKDAEEWNRTTGGRGTQLGLWHTHPEPTPQPSPTDLEDCRKVLETGSFAVGGLLYIIVGTKNIGCWFAKYKEPLILLGYFEP
ncbi:Mov34/MPN/PAD-1 family protein [uncultured Deefgea sp.]|uniref:Mov34/MPN/PAD-1 family protein n=1 Tax=uncultured Deefgea sp. TaxID=1304914 RepID=UPI00259A7917|nr:Mov34/MPN/PAD-1 family protein [uncultured Deefgea sp.]